MTLLKIIIFCVFGVMQYLCGLKLKKNIIFHILYCCPAFLKCVRFYKAHRSEKRGVL